MKKLLLATCLQTAIISAGILTVDKETERAIMTSVMGQNHVTQESRLIVPPLNQTITKRIEEAKKLTITPKDILTAVLRNCGYDAHPAETMKLNFEDIAKTVEILITEALKSTLAIHTEIEKRILKNIMDDEETIAQARITIQPLKQISITSINAAIKNKLCTFEELVAYIVAEKYNRQPRIIFEVNAHDIQDAVEHFTNKHTREQEDIFDLEL